MRTRIRACIRVCTYTWPFLFCIRRTKRHGGYTGHFFARSLVYCVWSMGACAPIDQMLRFRLSIAFGRWAPARPSTKRSVFGEILADDGARFKPLSRGVWGAAAPQENVRTQLTEPTKTKRLVDGRACAHRPNAIDKRTKKRKIL